MKRADIIKKESKEEWKNLTNLSMKDSKYSEEFR